MMLTSSPEEAYSNRNAQDAAKDAEEDGDNGGSTQTTRDAGTVVNVDEPALILDSDLVDRIAQTRFIGIIRFNNTVSITSEFSLVSVVVFFKETGTKAMISKKIIE